MSCITQYASIKARRGIIVNVFYYFLIISTLPCEGGAAIGPTGYYRARPPSLATENKEATCTMSTYVLLKLLYIGGVMQIYVIILYTCIHNLSAALYMSMTQINIPTMYIYRYIYIYVTSKYVISSSFLQSAEQ